MTASSSPSRRAIRASRKWKRGTFSNGAAVSTSPLFTRTDMLRGFFLIFLLFGIALVAIFGFRGQKSTGSPIEVFPDMVRQPKSRAQAPSNFFADGRGSRMPISGTIPIGYELPKAAPAPSAAPGGNASAPRAHLAFSEGNDYFNTGRMGEQWGTGMPDGLQVNPALMQRGRERFNITCAMCHGATAAGNGVTKNYGLSTVVTLQDERIRKMADGELFNTITNGKNTMMPYGPNVSVTERGEITASRRAWQRSQSATEAAGPPQNRAELDKPPPAPEASKPEAAKK